MVRISATKCFLLCITMSLCIYFIFRCDPNPQNAARSENVENNLNPKFQPVQNMDEERSVTKVLLFFICHVSVNFSVELWVYLLYWLNLYAYAMAFNTFFFKFADLTAIMPKHIVFKVVLWYALMII